MPKQLNVDLRFNADTTQAKKQIQDLQASLSKLGLDASKSMNFNSMNSELREATNNVNMLKAQLQSAFNVNTGKLDLTKFNQEMQQSGMSIEKYHKSLISLGPDGRKAFTELANAVSQADIPLLKTNKLLTEMGTVLKNTIKWQISSSAIHGFMGAIQQAYGYAQDLNESLTNIQIVTQHSTDQMAAFAAQANRAAQALSTTTTSYTDAALIFYQQGLDDQAVKERTDATIKMAQVTGDAATEVSSYMTAIWNNFDDGTESLEHYADVITALGAATASSSSEIAEGLSKFASIADTVGLSYEYATSALATVVAQTRQSADVVGTAFKTIFARIQDLEQGATLEDGVDLGQYAKALAKVGVDVLDTNGQLREMDDILDDIGQRWGELGEAERVALAQNVAGQRQYAQFMAIFENWDTFKTNLGTANASEGTLQEQADIYAESWEASSKRVRAAMEGIYQSIIDDDFFITINDFLSDNLNGLNNLIKALGGLPGLLSIIGTLTTRYFGPQMANTIRDVSQSVLMLTSTKARQNIQNSQLEILNKAKNDWADDSAESTIYKGKLDIQTTYLQNVEKLTDLQKLAIDYEKEQYDILSKQVLEKQELVEQTSKEIEELTRKQHLMIRNNGGDNTEYVRSKSQLFSSVTYLGEQGINLEAASQLARLEENLKSVKGSNDGTIAAYKEDLKQLMQSFNWTAEAKEKFDAVINTPVINGARLFKGITEALKLQGIEFDKVKSNAEAYEAAVSALTRSLTAEGQDTEKARASAEAMAEAIFKNTSAVKGLENGLNTLDAKVIDINTTIRTAGMGIDDWATKIVNFSNTIMQVSMAINNIKGIIDVINNDDMSGGEKLLSIMTSIGMTLMVLIPAFKNLTITKNLMALADLKLLTVEELKSKVNKKEITEQTLLNTAKLLGIDITKKMTMGELSEAVAKELSTKSSADLTKMLIKQAAAEMMAYWPLMLIVAAIGAVIGAIKYYQYTQESSLKHTENAIKAAENLKNQYEEMKSSYEDLKATIEDYSGAEEALEKLAKGTAEWASTLVNANDQAREIIDTLNLVQGQDWVVDENGLIQINESSLERGQQEQSQQMIQSHATAMMAEAYAAFSDIENTVHDYREQINEDYREQLLAASQMGPGAQSEISRLTHERDRLLQEVEDNYGAEYEAGLTNYNATASIAAQELLTQNSNYLYSSDEIQSLVAGASVNGYNNLEAYHDYLDAARSRGGLFNSLADDASREVVERYARESGLYDLADFNIKNYKANGQVEYTYTDENGEEQTGLINPQDVASFLSAADAAGNLANNIDNLITVFSSLTNSVNGADQALLSFLSQQNMERLNAGDFASAQQEIETDNVEGISYDEASAYLSSQAEEMGFTLEEMASMAGYQSAYSYVNSFAEGMNNASDAWDDVNSSDWLGTFDETIQNNLSLGVATRIDNLISTLSLGPAGEAIGQELVDGMNTMLQDLDEDDIAPALDQLALIDWTSYDALENAADVMHEFGVEIDTSSEYWSQFANDMRIASGAIPDYTQLRQELQDINAILDDLDFGKVISDADYAKLVAYNDEWERFFLMQSNGSRVFIGDSQQLINAERARIISLQQEVNTRQQLAEQFDGTWGWNHEDGSFTAVNWGQVNSSNIEWEGTVSNLQNHIGSGDVTDQILTDLGYDTESLANLTADQFDELADRLNNYIHEDFAQANQELMEMYASTATNFYELNTMMSDGIINDEAYQKQSEYLLNTISSVEQLEDAYSAGYIALEQYNSALDGVIMRQAEAFGLEGESVLVQTQEMAEAYRLEAIYGDEAAGVAARLAIQNQLMNKGVNALANNWENWRDELETTDYTTQDYADTVVDVTAAIKDLVGIVDENFSLSSEFLKAEENLELLEQAAQGSEEAIAQLGVAVAQDLVENLESIEDSFDFRGLDIDTSGMFHEAFDNFDSDRLIVSNGLQELQEQINNLGIGEDISSILDTEEWVAALNRMALATNMSVDQMNDLLNSIGVEADVTTIPTKQKVQVPTYTTTTNVIRDDRGEDGLGEYVQETSTVLSGYDTMEGMVEVAQINTGDKAGTPPSLTYIGNGNVSSSAKSGGKSGGGGGGGKSSQKKKKDPTDESERYHVINNQLEDNTKLLEQMSKAKDRAYGSSKLSYMDAEIERQRESIALNEEKLRQVEEFLKLDQAAIRGFGAEFDANGTITNYDALMQEQIDKYNAAVDAYNNGSMDENAEAVFQQAEDEYNAFTEALKQYEETQDLWYEQYQAVADAKAELLSLQLQKIDYKVQLGVEWEDDDIERLDFLLGRIGDDAYKAAEAIGLLGDKATNALDKYNTYQQGLAETLSAIGVNDASSVIQRAMNGESLVDMAASQIDASTAGEAIEQMGNYISEMMKELEAASESIKEAFEQVKNVFSDSINQMDRYEEKIKHIQNVTKSYRNIIDIVGKDSLGVSNKILHEMNAMTVQQATNAESAAKAEMDMVQSQLQETEARLAQATTDEERAYWQDLIKEQEDALITATENFHQAWEDALQANLEAFEQNIELVMDSFSKAIGNVESLKYQFDMQKSVKDLYEPDYESWYQLSNLVEDIDKTLANGEALRYQQDLLDLEQEIVGLQEKGAKLSEYDLEYLRLRYESKLALAQLDEAENAKSQVRMSRDNEGNYSYVYTADEDAVADAENNYRQKLYEMEKANQEYIDNLQVQLLDLNDQMLEEITRAREIYGNDTEALRQAIVEIENEFAQKGEFIREQMGHVFENNTRLREEDMVSYYEYTGDIYAANVDLTEDFSETFLAIQTGTKTLQEYFEGIWFPALDNTFVNINDVLNEFRENEDNIMREAGTSMDDFANDASSAMQEVTDETNVLTDATKKYGEEAVRRFAEAAQAWQNGPAQMISTINAQADAIAALAQQYIALKSAIEAAAAAARSMPSSSGATAYTPNTYTPSPGGNGGGGGKNLLGGTPSTEPVPSQVYQFLENLAIAKRNAERNGTKLSEAQLEQAREYIRRYGITGYSFDTGGYTGVWGSDGRWAMLHEKELVLNADDTKNFLAAVDIVRSLASSIDLKAMTANTSGINLSTPSSSGEILEQKVEVTANFPNVTDRNEIEEAFGNIINLASQYANRKQ